MKTSGRAIHQATWLYDTPDSDVVSLPCMKGSYGKQLIAALVPAVFKDQTALMLATGIAYSTINDWANGKSSPTLEKAEQIADVLAKRGIAISAPDLLAGRSPGATAAIEYDDPYPPRAPLLRALRESSDPRAVVVLEELVHATGFAGAEAFTVIDWIEEAAEVARKIERRKLPKTTRAVDPTIAAAIETQKQRQREVLGDSSKKKKPR